MKKLNIIALLCFLGAVAWVVLLDTPTTRLIQDRVMKVLSPFIRAGAETEKNIKNVVQEPVDIAGLQRDNERLQQEVQRLRIIAQKYEQVSTENNKFRGMLGYQSNVNMKLTAARVLRRSASNWWNTLIIDKGSEDNIGATDSPVITDVGLVGKLGKIAAHTAEVILLTDEECRVAARIEGTQAKGILSGDRGGLEIRPDLRLKFLDRAMPIEPGANVYSSGDGGVFPAGLLLGKVKQFVQGNISGEAIVDSAVDFSLLEDVFVVQMETATAAAQ